MSITAQKKANFKKALQLLINDFNAHNIDHSESGRMNFWVPNEDGEPVSGEISRDCDVCFWDEPELEDQINQAIESKILNLC